jgi:hypothetical protein
VPRGPVTTRTSDIRQARTLVATHHRFWAALPATVGSIALYATKNGTGDVLAVIARPPVQRGVCAKCGCTEDDACDVNGYGDPCAWVNKEQTLCSCCGDPR